MHRKRCFVSQWYFVSRMSAFNEKLDNKLLNIYITKMEYNEKRDMKDFIKVMKALSDPNRVKIVKMLQHRVMCVCEMKEALGISQPSVSKHLKILEEADLVKNRKDGLWVNYYLTDGGRSPYVDSLLGNLRHWLEHEPEIEELKGRLPNIRREEICGG